MWWDDWLKNLWSPRPPAKPRSKPFDPESTQDYATPPASVTASGSARLRFGIVSDKGTVREQNEDNFYVPGGASAELEDDNTARGLNGHLDDRPAGDGPEGLFLVADGMGGQLAGEEASRMAVELVPTELAKRLNGGLDDKGLQRAVRDAVARANEEILARSHLDSGFNNMGTTIVLALFRNDKVFVAGIGDSRAYRLRDSRLEQLTKDHSLAKALEEAGTIKPEEVSTHKFNHVLYLYLGSKDAREGPEDVRVLDCRPGDRFLLASDGLTGVVADETIAELLGTCADPQAAAQMLVRRAIDNRSKDNITCLVVHVDAAAGG